MYDDLKDKRVVVTGAASGIGLATARRFVKESCRVRQTIRQGKLPGSHSRP